jgi:hypothetical protein
LAETIIYLFIAEASLLAETIITTFWIHLFTNEFVLIKQDFIVEE